MLIVGRAVAGLGAAGIINGAITIVSSCAPLEKRPGESNLLWARTVTVLIKTSTAALLGITMGRKFSTNLICRIEVIK